MSVSHSPWIQQRLFINEGYITNLSTGKVEGNCQQPRSEDCMAFLLNYVFFQVRDNILARDRFPIFTQVSL